MAKDEIRKNLEEANKQLNEFQEELGNVNEQLQSIGVSIGSAISGQLKNANELTAKLAKKYKTDIESSINRASKGLNNYTELQDKINKGQDASKELEKEKAKLEKERTLTLRRIEFLQRNGVELDLEDVANLEEGFSLNQKILSNLENQNTERQKSLSLSSKLIKGLDGFLKNIDPSGNLSNIFDLDQTAKDWDKLEKDGINPDNFKNLGEYGGIFFKNIDKGALRLGAFYASWKLTLNIGKQLDETLTNIRKEFGLSRGEASKLNFELTNTFGDLAANVENILKANKALNQTLGDTGIIFDEEIRESAASTLYRLKLSEEAVGNLGKLALASGKSFAETELSQARGALSAEKEFGIRLNLKNILEESNNITGALRINTERLPGGLAKAVSVAKSLGAEFKTIADAAGQLLDFESSIQKELEAELLIGRDLNLERARLLALNGDIEGVTRELVAQAGSLEELQSMNVLQQNALAGALGISSDQLSDILLNQKSLNAAAQEGLDRKAEEVLAGEKALSVQEQLTLLTQKFVDVLKIGFGVLVGLTTALALIAAPFTFGASTIAAAGLITGLGTMGAMYMAEGGMVTGPTRAVIGEAGPEAVIPLNDNTPLIKQANETNKLLREIASKQGTVRIDSTRAGTAFAMGTYQVQ